MKVIINNVEGTYFSSWSTNSGWRYIAVTVIKNYDDFSTAVEESSSQILIFIDKSLSATMTINSHFQDD